MVSIEAKAPDQERDFNPNNFKTAVSQWKGSRDLDEFIHGDHASRTVDAWPRLNLWGAMH